MNRFAGIDIERNVACRLRDGVTLRSDVYRPRLMKESLPVLLMRQPYGKAIASTVTYAHPAWYANQGYIVVIQDVRGRGASEGVFQPFVQEVNDGYDAVEWAARLSGSDGKVGMYGFSYQGTTQWAAAASRPPHLTAIAPAMCAADLYRGWFYPHGRFALGSQLPWAAQLGRDEARRRGQPQAEERLARMMQGAVDWVRHLPLTDVEDIVEFAPYYRDWLEHATYDGYWKERNWLERLQEYSVPALHVGGWYDTFLEGTLQSFAALTRGESNTRNAHRLVVGPWMHIPWGREAGGVNHGAGAYGHIDAETVRWFDFWLKGKGDLVTAPVRYFELGSHEWREASSWPTEPTEFTDVAKHTPRSSAWRLCNQGWPANGQGGGGTLVPLNSKNRSAVAYDVLVYDARLPMPCDSYLPTNRSAIQERFEILVYTSAPISDPISFLGTPVATVWVEALDGPTDVVVTLSRVSSAGEASFLSVGRSTSDGGLGDARSELAGATEGGSITIRLRPIGIQLAAGDCLRVEVTASAFPLFARHPNGVSEEEIGKAGPSSLSIATLALGLGDDCPSVLTMPIRLEKAK